MPTSKLRTQGQAMKQYFIQKYYLVQHCWTEVLHKTSDMISPKASWIRLF